MTKPTIQQYRDMSAEVWQIFKKYYPDDADTNGFPDDATAIGNKYKGNIRYYEIVVKLLRVYMQELNEIKGVQNERNKKDNDEVVFKV